VARHVKTAAVLKTGRGVFVLPLNGKGQPGSVLVLELYSQLTADIRVLLVSNIKELLAEIGWPFG
jgi:hypothetical protein